MAVGAGTCRCVRGWKLYAADCLRYFGFDADVGLTAAIRLGLTPSEGSALLEVRVTPEAEAGLNPTAFCHVLTPALATQGLRDVAGGVFPSFMWDDVQYHMDLDEWLKKVFWGQVMCEARLSGLGG